MGRGWATGPRFLPLPGGPRAWHVAWQGRVEWRREHFYPLEERDQSMVHEEVLAVRQKLRDGEDRAYDRFLSARVVLAEALKAEA